MNALQITAYLTPEKIPAVDVDGRASDNSTIYLMPESMAGRDLPLFVDLFLRPTDKNPIQCEFKPKVVVGHVWSPDPALPASVAPFIATASAVQVDIPPSPFWSGADFNPQLTGNDASIGPTPPSAPCPESESDVLLIPSAGWGVTCHPVPGEEIRVTHGTHGHGSFAVSGYHSCTGLTGGWITARRAHPIVDEAWFYDVEVEGITHTNLIATDWEPRSVGDWCFLLRREGASDLTYPATTPKSPDDDILMLAPLEILGKG